MQTKRNWTWTLAVTLALALVPACTTDSGGSGAGAGDVVDEGGTIDVNGDAGDTTTSADTLADTASGDTTIADSSATDVNAAACPGAPPIGTNQSCTDGLTCNYGQECCCGTCHPSTVCTCAGGKFGCYATDACMLPPDACVGDTTADDSTAEDAGSADTTGGDAKGDGSLGAPCNEVMSSIMPCVAGLYCARPDGQCTGMGVCTKKPEACDMMYDPVCGCDGKTHGNSCSAANAGVNVNAKGECEAPNKLQWFGTCGDPACSGWKQKTDVADCTTEKAGLACTTENAVCDPHDGCNSLLRCTDTDPKQQPGGCPISRVAFKTAIDYVDQAEAHALAQRLLAVKLATYQYKAQGPNGRRHLGFLIDDDPSSPAVDSNRDMVDLYGYLSMAVATVQQQQRQIDALAAQSAQQQAAIDALRATLAVRPPLLP